MATAERISWRQVDGILLLDKPVGLSSNQALQRAKRMLRARKAGHTGSLDPFATGMLPLCFGQATKVCSFLLDAHKEYIVRAVFGISTTTGDPEGEVLERRTVSGLDAAFLEPVLDRFRGQIDQVPPMYSALKHKGERLYELARRGETVERPARSVTIHELELLGLDGNVAELRVRCSKGTYIRSLVEDIATALDTVAHAGTLRRTAVHPFEGLPTVTLDQLADECAADDGTTSMGRLLALDTALVDHPAVHLDADQQSRLKHGQIVNNPSLDGSVQTLGMVRIYGPEGVFLGIGELEPGEQLKPRRLMATGEPRDETAN